MPVLPRGQEDGSIRWGGVTVPRLDTKDGCRVQGRSVVTLAGPRSGVSFDIGEAYDAHARELFGFALNSLRDRTSAEECVQDVFLRAWRSRERYDADRASVRTWLFAIMRNAVRDRFRARERQTSSVGLDGLHEVPGVHADPTEHLSVLEALSTLSKEHRQAVVGIHLVGASYAELSEALKVPVATLRTRTFYGLRALRDYLREGEADHDSPGI